MKNQFVKCISQLLFLLLIIGVLPVYAQKKSKEKIYRLPDDLETLAGDPALLKKPEGLTVAAYAFPNYHASALHNKIYSQGWTEYNLIRSARPWFEGHQQPRTPLLGELDESKPSTWETYNKLCKQSGIDVLIWDWYWYDGKPCLHFSKSWRTPIIPTCHTTSTGQSFYANAVTPLSAITTGAIFSAGHAPKPPVSFNDCSSDFPFVTEPCMPIY